MFSVYFLEPDTQNGPKSHRLREVVSRSGSLGSRKATWVKGPTPKKGKEKGGKGGKEGGQREEGGKKEGGRKGKRKEGRRGRGRRAGLIVLD